MRSRLLVLCLSLSGCFAVLPGYTFLGVGMTQRERDEVRDDAMTVFWWDEVPDGRQTYNPLAGAGNILLTLVCAPLLWPLMGLLHIAPLDDEDDDDWDYYHELAPSEEDRQEAIRGKERRAAEAEARQQELEAAEEDRRQEALRDRRW